MEEEASQENYIHFCNLGNLRGRKLSLGTSLVVQWVRICLPKEGTWVQSLVWEDFTHMEQPCLCATTSEPQFQSPRAATTEAHMRKASALQRESHHNEKSEHRSEEQPPLATTRERPHKAMKNQHSHK